MGNWNDDKYLGTAWLKILQAHEVRGTTQKYNRYHLTNEEKKVIAEKNKARGFTKKRIKEINEK